MQDSATLKPNLIEILELNPISRELFEILGEKYELIEAKVIDFLSYADNHTIKLRNGETKPTIIVYRSICSLPILSHDTITAYLSKDSAILIERVGSQGIISSRHISDDCPLDIAQRIMHRYVNGQTENELKKD